MPDAIFEHPRLVAIYDALDSDRRDLDAYAAMVDEFAPKGVIDLGCGTGLLARHLTRRGVAVTGVDPAAGSLEYAQAQPGALPVRWILGDASALPTNAADLVLMTGNAAQAVIDPADWDDLLRHTHGALRPGGRFVFETRDPSRRAWERWTRAASLRKVEIDGVGLVETWVELTAVDLPLISFRHTWAFKADGAVLTSDSTLRFRDRGEVEDDLRRHGYVVDEVRDAPDRPGLEFVFVARRTDHLSRHVLTKPGARVSKYDQSPALSAIPGSTRPAQGAYEQALNHVARPRARRRCRKDVENGLAAPSQGQMQPTGLHRPRRPSMAKYLLLKHYRGAPDAVDNVPMDQWTPEEVEDHFQYMADFAARLEGTGEFVDAQALSPEGTFVRYDGEGRPPVTDGPFAETKDLIAGWMVIDVETYERALELAGDLSAAPGANGKPIHEWLEVRPLLSAPPTVTE